MIGPLVFHKPVGNVFLHHEEDDISNLPLEIKILLPTELSRLKIEQTDWHDVKKIEFWAFKTFCYYYSSNIPFYFRWLKTIVVQWFSFWPKETTRRGTTIIGENHKSTYTRGAYWICNRVSELRRKKWKWTRRRREEEALAYTIYIPVCTWFFKRYFRERVRAGVAQQTWYHTTIIHTFTMSGRFMSLEAEQSHYRHFVHLPAAFLYFQVYQKWIMNTLLKVWIVA